MNSLQFGDFAPVYGQETCLICWKKNGTRDAVIELNCRHIFHTNCWNQVVNAIDDARQVYCPGCRMEQNTAGNKPILTFFLSELSLYNQHHLAREEMQENLSTLEAFEKASVAFYLQRLLVELLGKINVGLSEFSDDEQFVKILSIYKEETEKLEKAFRQSRNKLIFAGIKAFRFRPDSTFLLGLGITVFGFGVKYYLNSPPSNTDFHG